MRKTICVEGKRISYLSFLEHGAVKWDEDTPVAISWQYNWDKIVGTASDFRREEGGQITAELNITDSATLALAEHGDISPTIYANELVGTKGEDDKMSYSSCKIRGLSFVLKDQVAW